MSGTPTPNKKWKPINKALLTPCRRPGLSRIIKTPLHIHENQEPAVININIKTPPAIKISLQQNSPPKCTKVVQNLGKPSILKDRSLSNTIVTDKPNGSSPKLKNPVVKAKCTKMDQNLGKPSILKDHSLSNMIVTDERKGSNPELKNPVVTVSRIALPSKRTVKPKKIVNRLSIKRSSSPDELSDFDNIPNTPENELSSPQELTEQIEEIEKRIKLKETRLEDLKRAAGYAKKNNVQELEELTRVWKEGCNKALDHLLVKLQEHGQIEMSSLLKKLNIPISVIETSDDS